MVEISRLLILKCFKGNGSNFIIDPRRNGKPVKGTKNRSNGVETTGRWNDYTSKRVLGKLEAMDGMKRKKNKWKRRDCQKIDHCRKIHQGFDSEKLEKEWRNEKQWKER